MPPSREAFIGLTYPWNQGWSTCSTQGPIQIGNQFRFYFGGQSGAHIHVKQGPRKVGVIGLAEMTVDRFASIIAGFMEDRLVTKPIRWPGGDLLLNASTTRELDADPRLTGGRLSVEVWDAEGRPVPGYSGDDQGPFDRNTPSRGDKETAVFRWPGDRSLNDLIGQDIRLVFHMQDFHLYSFRSNV